jgi:metal-sulfur cluster biosynthetic enzyme
LIYDVIVDANHAVKVEMTLTAPNCPAAQTLPSEVKTYVGVIDGVTEVHVEIVWDPPWSMDRMSEAAKLHLGML